MKDNPSDPRIPLLCAFALCPAFLAPLASAADSTWNGGGADANWMTTANWDVVPLTDDVLIFDGTTQTTNVNDFADLSQFGGLIFETNAGAFTASGNTVQLEGNVSNFSSSDQDFSGIDFYMQNGSRIFDTGAQTLTIGDLWSSGSPVKTHTKVGPGTLILTANGHSEAVGGNSGDWTRFTVDEGTLQLDANPTQERQTVESVTINNGGTVKFGEGSTNPANAWVGLLFGFVTINEGGTLDLNGHTGKDGRFQTLNGDGGLITNTSGDLATLTIASRSNATETFGGVIEDGPGGGFTGVEIDYGGRNGGRVNVFTGTNTYSLDTQITDQNLIINGDQSGCEGRVLVPSANGARLGGFGTIGGDVYIGCVILPGDASGANAVDQLPGKLTILGDLYFNPIVEFNRYEDGSLRGGTRQQEYDFDLTDWGEGLTPGTEYDNISTRELFIDSTNEYKLNINVSISGDAVVNFDDSEQVFNLVTTEFGVGGLIDGDGDTRNWQVNVTGLATSGIWTVEVSDDNLSLLLRYTPSAPGADVVWDGGGTDDNLSTALNWEGDVAPVSPQSMGFAGSTRTNPINDTGTDESFEVICETFLDDPILTVASKDGIEIGQTVSGPGIPENSTVIEIDPDNPLVTISQNPTQESFEVTLTFSTVENTQVDGLTFLSDAAAFSLTGRGLALGDDDEVVQRVTNDSTNLQTLGLDLQIASNSNQFWARNGDILHTGRLFSAASRTISSIGTNTTTLAGTEDNSFLQVQALEGTLVLAKESSPDVHGAFNINHGQSALGTVQLAGSGGDQIAGNITIDGGFLDLNGNDETVGNINSSIEGGGTITNNLAETTATLTVSDSNGNDFNRVADGDGIIAMTYQSASNQQTRIIVDSEYSGGTTVDGAYLRIERTTPIGSGPVTFVGPAEAKSSLFTPSNGAYTTGIVHNDLIVNAPNRGKIRWGRTQTVTGALLGDGDLVVTHENRTNQGTTVTGDWSAFTGTVIFKPGDSGAPTGNTTNLTLSNPTGLPAAVLTMITEYDGVPDGNAGSNGDLRYGGPAGGVLPIGDLNTDSDTGVAPLAAYNNTVGTATFEVGALGLDSSFNALVRDGNGVTAITKVGVGTWTLTNADSTYSGQTAVDAGTLSIVHDLADGSTVRVATGAVLNLATAGTDTVDSLWLDGSPVNSGTYGPLNSTATNKSSHFTGAGILSVISDAPAGYDLWAQTYVDGQTPEEDFDLDGVENGIEFFFGETVPTFTPNPALVDGTVTWPNGGNIPSEDYGTQFVVQTSPDLEEWTGVDVNDPNLSNSPESVSYTPAADAGRIFIRFEVTPN